MTTESPFVEDSFALTPRDILRNIERPRRIGTNADDRRADVNYWLDHTGDDFAALISVGKNEPQRVVMEWQEITFGERAYFRCACGLRASKLHLPLGGNEFKCRKCHKLQYQLTHINRHSVAGRALYRVNRLQKLLDQRASMGRILYKGNYSDRFERFLRMCDRAGFDSIVQGANDLKALIKG